MGWERILRTFPHLFCKVKMWYLYTQKNLIGWRQWKAVLKQKAMLFSIEEWYNPNIHLEKEVKHCFGFMLQYPSFILFLFSTFIWQNLLLKITWHRHSHTAAGEGKAARFLPTVSSQQPIQCCGLCSYCKGSSTSASQQPTITNHTEGSPWHTPDSGGKSTPNCFQQLFLFIYSVISLIISL